MRGTFYNSSADQHLSFVPKVESLLNDLARFTETFAKNPQKLDDLAYLAEIKDDVDNYRRELEEAMNSRVCGPRHGF